MDSMAIKFHSILYNKKIWIGLKIWIGQEYESTKELKVKPIKNGTVIDHIKANKALSVLRILGLPSQETAVTIAMNVQSSQMGSKDIVKIEEGNRTKGTG